MSPLSLRAALPALALGSLALLALPLTGCGKTAAEEHGHTHDADDPAHAPGDGHTHAEPAGGPLFTYLRMNGDFEMDPVQAATRNDPRNPSRVRLATTDSAGTASRFAFYAHDDPDRLVADCGYQYAGSRPDPHYFPAESKTSIWDVFERTATYAGDCDRYAVVAARAPHGETVHMHLRYGPDADAVLAMSNAPVDSSAFEPWWSLYCAPGRTTSCD